MPQKPKPNKRPNRAGTPAALAVTPEQARDALDSGHFREAIDAFKALLKSGLDPAARDGLAAAYAGRARQLAAKGMLKEALVMWDNRAALGAVPVSANHLELLVRLGQIPRMLKLLPSLADPAAGARLRSQLAARYLAGDREALDTALPPDDPILIHAPAARTALDAWCAGDAAVLDAALAALPFRSPYRELVMILKGLARLDTAPAEAASLLARIPDDAPFGRLAAAARLALATEHELQAQLPRLGPMTRAFALPLRGWSDERLTLWQLLHRPDPRQPDAGQVPLAPRELVRFVHRHAQRLGETWARQGLLRLLLPKPSVQQTWLRECGAPPVTMTEIALLNGWVVELEAAPDPQRLLHYWRAYAERLSREPEAPGHAGGDRALRIALTLRRTEQRTQILERAAPDGSDALASEVADALEDSLRYDPDDRDTYLRLIRWFLRGNDLKDARRLLKQAQERWPEDKAVLTAALDTAIASAAFRKAATLARAILAVDPINSGARDRLVDAYLSHARKNLANGRPDLAARALDAADEWARGERMRERRALLAGLIQLRTDPPAGSARLRELVAAAGNGLDGRLALLLESAACELATGPLIAQLALPPLPKVRTGMPWRSRTPPEDLLACFARLRHHLDHGGHLPRHVAMHLEPALTDMARLKLERADFESICETLKRADWDRPRLAFARAALKRWKSDPLFEFHAFEARYANTPPWNIPRADLGRLEAIAERIGDSGDTRLMLRIQALLERMARRMGPLNPFGGDDDDEDYEDYDDDDEGPPSFTFGQTAPGELPPFLIDMIRTLGPEGLRSLRDMPGPLGQALRMLEREMGPEAFERLVESARELAGGPSPRRRPPRRRKE